MKEISEKPKKKVNICEPKLGLSYPYPVGEWHKSRRHKGHGSPANPILIHLTPLDVCVYEPDNSLSGFPLKMVEEQKQLSYVPTNCMVHEIKNPNLFVMAMAFPSHLVKVAAYPMKVFKPDRLSWTV